MFSNSADAGQHSGCPGGTKQPDRKPGPTRPFDITWVRKTAESRAGLYACGGADAVLDCPDRRLGAILGVDLAHDILEMHLHRRFGDVEIARDHLVRLPGQQAAQDLDL